MRITIDYKQAHGDMQVAIANALGIDANRVQVIVTPAKTLIPFCAEWRVVKSCGDICCKVDNEYLLLNVI